MPIYKIIEDLRRTSLLPQVIALYINLRGQYPIDSFRRQDFPSHFGCLHILARHFRMLEEKNLITSFKEPPKKFGSPIKRWRVA